MTGLSVIHGRPSSVPETWTQLISLLGLNSSNMSLTQEEQSRVFLAFEQLLQNDTEDQLQAPQTDIIVSYVTKYVPPFLAIVGLFGNIFAICILLNKNMVRQTTNVFLAVLAFVDCIVLLVGLLRGWLGDISGVDIQLKANWLCKSVTLLTYCSSQFSAWLIVAVTVMRYIAVSKPHQASRYCNHKIAKRVMASLAITVLAINLHFIWTVKLNENNTGLLGTTKCEAEEGFGDFILNIWPWIDASVFALAPSLLLVIFNTLIIVLTIRATIWRHGNQQLKGKRKGKMSRGSIKLTVTLLTVSFSFLVTTLPMATVMVLQNYWRHETDESSNTIEFLSQKRMIRTIAEVFMYLNHAINFFLYCATGEKFRNQMRKTFCMLEDKYTSRTSDHSSHLYCLKHKRSHVHTSQGTTTSV